MDMGWMNHRDPMAHPGEDKTINVHVPERIPDILTRLLTE